MYENFTIFENLTSQEIASLEPTVKEYEKDCMIVCEGDRRTSFGMVVSGEVQVYNDDIYGNRNIILNGRAGFLFGEALSILNIAEFPVSVVAATNCKVMFIKYKPVLAQNLLSVLARSNIEYRNRVTLLSQRSTRDKLMFYLSQEAKKNGSSFYIPFDRQELADYLCVERSAMSAEISKLVKEGYIETNRNWFRMLH